MLIGLLVGQGGYAICYGISEGHTLIPFLESISRKFTFGKPVVIADSGLLAGKNIATLQRGTKRTNMADEFC